MTKEILEKYGFVFKKQSSICGQDSWMGMDFWFHFDEPNLILRGGVDDLVLSPFSNSRIKTEQDLIDLFRILNIRIKP